MNNKKPAFLITIDTEGDNLWQQPRNITTKNAAFLPRFQSLCERYGFKPTYLTNYEMAKSDQFVEFGKDVQSRGTGEIGMHLHAWNSPPITPLTSDDFKYQPFLIDYPESIMRDKIAVMTDLLEEIFGTKMLSHRAGRWSFNNIYAQLLIEHGYCVDCSVTPHISWKYAGGTDFSSYPEHAYFVDSEQKMLELPMTIMKYDRSSLIKILSEIPQIGRGVRHFYPTITWLLPSIRNLKALLALVRQTVVEKRPYIEFMIHSSELMPGGSPSFVNQRQIETLYKNMEILFETISKNFIGMTLKDYYVDIKN
jgi:hypothetical protein